MEIVKEWDSKFFILPDNSMRANTNDKIDPLSKKIKIVTIVNADCGRCILKLQDWKEFINSIDTSKVGFVVLLCSTDNFESFNVLGDSIINFNYPYYKDINNNLFIKNKIPENTIFQTFLLDSLNHVLIIGDPIGNYDLNMLYMKEINKVK